MILLEENEESKEIVDKADPLLTIPTRSWMIPEAERFEEMKNIEISVYIEIETQNQSRNGRSLRRQEQKIGKAER